jgi:hypothetical protein
VQSVNGHFLDTGQKRVVFLGPDVNSPRADFGLELAKPIRRSVGVESLD